MSLFVPQLKIPFQSVIRWLRYLEPKSDVHADVWAKRHAEDVMPGDILFVWNVVYSPWGDSTVGIGVADGDSFHVSQLFFVTRWEDNKAVGYAISPDKYEREFVEDYFEKRALNAKQKGIGYYYSLVRSNPALAGERQIAVEALDSYGQEGKRSEDSQPPDLPYAFFQAAGYGVEARTGMMLPIDQIGYALFCDKEPPPGSPVPDIRRFTAPVYKDAHRDHGVPVAPKPPSSTHGSIPVGQSSPGDSHSSIPLDQASPSSSHNSIPIEPPVPTPSSSQTDLPAVSSVPPAADNSLIPNIQADVSAPPKMPSFFNQGNKGGGLSSLFGGANKNRPAPGAMWDHDDPAAEEAPVAPAETKPNSGASLLNLLAFDELESATEEAKTSDTAAGAPTELDVPPVQQAIPPISSMMDFEMEPNPVPPPVSLDDASSISADQTSTGDSLPSLGAAPSPMASMPVPKFNPMAPLPPISRREPPASVDPLNDIDAPSDDPNATVVHEPAMTASELFALTGGNPFDTKKDEPETIGSDLGVIAAALEETAAKSAEAAEEAEVVDASVPPYLREEPKTQGVEDIMAALDTSIKETTEARRQESKFDTSSRPRPGRMQAPVPKVEEVAPTAPIVEEPAAVVEQFKPELVFDVPAIAEAPSIAEPPAQPIAEFVEPATDLAADTAADAAADAAAAKRKAPDVAELARAQEMAKLAQLKEPAVKTGVAGLAQKLEHQASKASARLETQVDEIQNRLSEELKGMLDKINSDERRSAKSAEGLRMNMFGQMDSVANSVSGNVQGASKEGDEKIREANQGGASRLDEKHEYLRTSLSGSFDEVKARAETVAKSFEENLTSESGSVVSALEEMRNSWTKEFAELEAGYIDVLQQAYDEYKDRINAVSASATTVVSDRHNVFELQLSDLQTRHLKGLEHARTMLFSKLGRQFVASETEMLRLQTTSLDETLLPKLKQHREELRVVTGEFQHKLSQDLMEKGEAKVSEIEPILRGKKEKLSGLLKETTTVKDSIQEQLRARLRGIFKELEAFVEVSIDQAQNAYATTETQLNEIDRDIRALADHSTIENDAELLEERNKVLLRLDQITETNKETVLNTLRSNLASLEERGKNLQEELVSSMEQDAQGVRRASEQALVSIREAIRESFVAIQAAQEESMPM